MSLLATSGIPVLNYLPNFLTLAPLLSNEAVMYCTVLFCAVLCCAVLCCAVLGCIVFQYLVVC